MAARLNARHSESVLKRIKTSQLINRLQDHALGLLKSPPTEADPEGKPILMLDSQVRATCFLIERTLAKAEAPRDLHLTGNITLKQLIEGTQQPQSLAEHAREYISLGGKEHHLTQEERDALAPSRPDAG